MKATIRRDALSAALAAAGGAVAGRTTKPVLACVRVDAADGVLTVQGTDQEVGVRYRVDDVTVTRPGAAVLPPGKLSAIIRETSDQDITLDSDGDTTRIRLSSGRYELPGHDPATFPEVGDLPDDADRHTVTAGVLRTLTRRVAFAADKKESTRFAVTGVLWEPFAGGLRLVATDTKRLAVAEGTAELTGEPPAAGLVPLKAVSLLDRNLGGDDERVDVALGGNQIVFRTARGVLWSRLVEGSFPPWAKIIPAKFKHAIPVDPPAWLAAVRQAAILTDAESKRVDFTFSPGVCVLTAKGPDVGSAEIVLSLLESVLDGVGIAFDPAYLIEFLRAVEGAAGVSLSLTDGGKPALFTTGDGYRYLVMPLAS